jgi:protease-4
MHDQFVTDVADSREMDRERIEAVADGRAFTGRQALELGLVDELGGYDDALALLKDLCGITGTVTLIQGPKAKRDFVDRILSSLGLSVISETLPGAGGLGGLFGPRWVLMF